MKILWNLIDNGIHEAHHFGFKDICEEVFEIKMNEFD